MDCIVHRVAKSQTRMRDFHFTSKHSWLKNSMDKSLVGHSPWVRKESDMTELLSKQAGYIN